nr:MAG: hypothetical protein [Bacteriophage sp.]
MKGEKAMGMKGFKGFEKDFSCGGKQYEENTTYEEHGVGCCHKGVMHFCEDPWEVLNHYDLVDGNGNFPEFAEVEALGQVWNDGKKRATNKIHIGAKLGLKGFLKACIDFTIERTKFDGSSGNYVQIGSSGDSAQIGSSGNYAKIGSSGNSAQIGSSGNYVQIGSSGDSAKIGSSGYSAQIGSSGYSAQINSTGEDAVIMCAGSRSKAKGKKGSWITLAEWAKDEEKGRYVPICVKTERVDGEKIKENTYYTLKNGEFVEVEE